MATGTGKTWVLLAIGESMDWYSDRFLVVGPSHEVLVSLLNAFKYRRNQYRFKGSIDEDSFCNSIFWKWDTKEILCLY
jgi:predicted helicase